VKERDAASLYLGFSSLVLHIISERVKLGEHARIPFPWRLVTTIRAVDSQGDLLRCTKPELEFSLRMLGSAKMQLDCIGKQESR
jgi:hypothetical protein